MFSHLIKLGLCIATVCWIYVPTNAYGDAFSAAVGLPNVGGNHRDARKINFFKDIFNKPKVGPLYLINGTLCRFINSAPVCTTLSTNGFFRNTTNNLQPAFQSNQNQQLLPSNNNNNGNNNGQAVQFSNNQNQNQFVPSNNQLQNQLQQQPNQQQLQPNQGFFPNQQQQQQPQQTNLG